MVSKTPKKEELAKRASKALLQELGGYYSPTSQSTNKGSNVQHSGTDLKKMIEIVKNDSVAWGGITTLVDRIIEPEWFIVGKEGVRNEEAELRVRNKGFDFWRREMLTLFIIFKNAFGELVYTPDGGVKEIHVLPTQEIEIIGDKHGTVQGYRQIAMGGDQITWSPNEILHFRDVSLGLSHWAEVDLRTVWEAVVIKNQVKKFLKWLFETNQFRGVHNIKAIDEQAVKRYMTFLKESEKNIYKPIIVEGDFEYQIPRKIEGLEEINKVIYKLDEEILNLLQVPPIYAGLPDNSNRSNSDAQERALNTRVRSIQRLEEHFYRDLFKRMRVFGEFKVAPQSNQVMLDIIEQAQILHGMGMKKDLLGDFFRQKNIYFPPGEVFEEPEVPLPMGDNAPSRRGKPSSAPNKKIGTGERGTTRKDQLVKRASPDKFGQYPYVIV